MVRDICGVWGLQGGDNSHLKPMGMFGLAAGRQALHRLDLFVLFLKTARAHCWLFESKQCTMNLTSHRPWITPLVIGTFVLLSVTGVLMFFHLDTGMNKLAHQWLSWAILAAVGLHVLLNWPAFKRYLGQQTALSVIGACMVALALSFLPMPGAGKSHRRMRL